MAESLPWLCRILALVSAFGVGYLFGYSTPTWQADAALENVPRGEGRWDTDGDGGGCIGLGCVYSGNMLWAAFGWRPLPYLLIVVALVCFYLGWGLPIESEESADLDILTYGPLWLMAGAGALGYIIARVTDKGPVGPLE